eukprot:Rhum_TRINITY_DN10554_c0_g2::Rhum_TRINITY_DN10554_c0_g2_i1::g.38994::m.38994/K01303/APEH; acylaminoacyl-peptidase
MEQAATAARRANAARDTEHAGAAEETAELWRQVVRTPLVTKGILSNGGDTATLTLETADLDEDTRVSYERVFSTLPPPHRQEGDGGHPLPPVTSAVPAAALPPTFPSPTRRHSVRFVAGAAGAAAAKGGSRGRVELWGPAGLLASARTTGVHGRVPTSQQLQAVAWSDDERRVVYVAERAVQAAPAKLWEEGGGGAGGAGGRGAFHARDTWGEQLADFSECGLFVADFCGYGGEGVVEAAVDDAWTRDRSCALPVFVEDDLVAFVARPHAPLRAGLVFYNSRPTTLYTLRLPQQQRQAGPKTSGRAERNQPAEVLDAPCSIAAMRLRPGMRELVVLHAENTALHGSALSMARVCLVGGGPPLPVVASPRGDVVGDAFPGFFTFGGNADLHVSSTVAYVGSVCRSAAVVYEVPLAAPGQTLPRLLSAGWGGGGGCSWRILDVLDGVLLACSSSAVALPTVSAVRVATPSGAASGGGGGGGGSNAAAPQVVKLFSSQDVHAGVGGGDGTRRLLDSLRTEVRSFPEHHGSEVLVHRGTGWVAGGGGPPPPTVVFLHGGPHSADTNSYAHVPLFFLLLGFDFLSVNYGGSLGFGQRRVEELPGHIGTSDVSDVVGVLRGLGYLAADDDDDGAGGARPAAGQRLFVSGGSHGGFLSAHLTAQHPRLPRHGDAQPCDQPQRHA